MNNHAVKSDRFRYIRYEDGGEELYDHNNDPNEWLNQANNVDFSSTKDELQQLLPKVNSKWDKHSSYKFQPYYVKQKERTSEN